MGSVQRDIYRKGRQYDDDYAYTDAGVASLLKDVYRISEAGGYKGDIDAVTILCDLKLALDSDCLTPRMRQVIALYYFAQLTEEQTAEVIGITRQAVNYTLVSAIERISVEMGVGGARKGGRGDFLFEQDIVLLAWLNDVSTFDMPVYDVPEHVTDNILWQLSERGDDSAWETLRQRIHGAPMIHEDYSNTEEYPCFTEDQFKWRDRRVSYVPEISYDNRSVGSRRKTAFINNDDEWTYGRRIFEV